MDTEYLIIDSTIVRAHPDAASTPKSSGGGFSAKVQITMEGLDNPWRFILTRGQESDIAQAAALLSGYAG